jgi:hypothetical protein
MSAQTRYRTLVHNISRVYSSPDAGRTELLQAGIDEIVVVMAPASTTGWRMVKSDTERLLRVWSAKEGDSDVAKVVADQITGLLEELSTSAPVVDRIAHVNPYPSLVVEEFAPVSRMPFLAPSTERLFPDSRTAASAERASDLAPAPLVTVTKADEEEEDTEIASVPAEDESEQEEESEVASVPADDESEEENSDDDDDDDDDAPAPVVAPLVEEKEEEEVVEPEEEETEEEEAGMEVEQVMIRGRTYWKDTNTNKLYAVVRGEDGEDDVGDEVGILENGKPRFLAK